MPAKNTTVIDFLEFRYQNDVDDSKLNKNAWKEKSIVANQQT